ncbi:uncharacterized protein TNCV_4331331 [Trichonephila clavipes]|nr:uncharacterized protein TNCV_4331331 [Trichonephila clavipes]
MLSCPNYYADVCSLKKAASVIKIATSMCRLYAIDLQYHSAVFRMEFLLAKKRQSQSNHPKLGFESEKKTIIGKNISELLSPLTSEQPATVGNACTGFKKCGIETHNPLVFSEHDFAASKATDHDVVSEEIEKNSANLQTLVVENQHINPPEEQERHLAPQFEKRWGSCQVIYSQFGLAIHQNDHQSRRRFVDWAQNEITVVPDFHKRILFSDEAHFWLNGYVNKQNCRICCEANPQVYVETPLHPEKMTVWCALWAVEILLQKR